MKNTAELDENNSISKELTIKDRINSEFDRIIGFFEDLNFNDREVLLPLIQNAAFMRITLEDLQELIQRDGVVEVYRNGENQYGTKQSAALQSYNSLIKNYSAVIKSLKDSLPPERRAAFSPVIAVKPSAEENRKSDAEREAERKAELDLAVEYQAYERKQPPGAIILSFGQWKEQRG